MKPINDKSKNISNDLNNSFFKEINPEDTWKIKDKITGKILDVDKTIPIKVKVFEKIIFEGKFHNDVSIELIKSFWKAAIEKFDIPIDIEWKWRDFEELNEHKDYLNFYMMKLNTKLGTNITQEQVKEFLAYKNQYIIDITTKLSAQYINRNIQEKINDSIQEMLDEITIAVPLYIRKIEELAKLKFLEANIDDLKKEYQPNASLVDERITKPLAKKIKIRIGASKGGKSSSKMIMSDEEKSKAKWLWDNNFKKIKRLKKSFKDTSLKEDTWLKNQTKEDKEIYELIYDLILKTPAWKLTCIFIIRTIYLENHMPSYSSMNDPKKPILSLEEFPISIDTLHKAVTKK
ncbi:MAG: hypothetical protein PHC34_04710 [Candidatus Gastranaerophilales bacterium]|nr:hypothetical protein [Candidatus Gastranaerophilales bacterium]